MHPIERRGHVAQQVLQDGRRHGLRVRGRLVRRAEIQLQDAAAWPPPRRAQLGLLLLVDHHPPILIQLFREVFLHAREHPLQRVDEWLGERMHPSEFSLGILPGRGRFLVQAVPPAAAEPTVLRDVRLFVLRPPEDLVVRKVHQRLRHHPVELVAELQLVPPRRILGVEVEEVRAHPALQVPQLFVAEHVQQLRDLGNVDDARQHEDHGIDAVARVQVDLLDQRLGLRGREVADRARGLERQLRRHGRLFHQADKGLDLLVRRRIFHLRRAARRGVLQRQNPLLRQLEVVHQPIRPPELDPEVLRLLELVRLQAVHVLAELLVLPVLALLQPRQFHQLVRHHLVVRHGEVQHVVSVRVRRIEELERGIFAAQVAAVQVHLHAVLLQHKQRLEERAGAARADRVEAEVDLLQRLGFLEQAGDDLRLFLTDLVVGQVDLL